MTRLSRLLAPLLLLGILVPAAVSRAAAAPRTTTCGKWSLVPSGNLGKPVGSNDNALAAVSASSGKDAWAAGYAYRFGLDKAMVEHWNGTKWTALLAKSVSGQQNYLQGVADLAPNNVWAVGYYGPYGSYAPLIEHYNGKSWKMVAANAPGNDGALYSIAAISSKNIWAVGSSNVSGGTSNLILLHWNGHSWSSASATPSNPFDENFLQAVGRIPGSSDLWAVGSGYMSGWHTLILQLHNGSWSQVPSDDTGTTFPSLLGVAATSAGNALAVGNDASEIAERWNGSNWALQTTPTPSSGYYVFRDAAAVGSTIWIAGARHDTNNNDHPEMFKWTSAHGFTPVTAKTPPKAQSTDLVAVTRIPGTKHLWAVGSYYTSTSNLITVIESYC